MPSWILDLDGTLMPSHAVDNDCYWQAVSEVFDTPVATQDLGQFRHATDGGILAQWSQERLNRTVQPAELDRLKARFLELLASAERSDPSAFRPFPGCENWLREVSDRGDLVAIATGGWAHTARFKLGVSGLDRYDLPLASADDGLERTTIMRVAQARLGHPPDSEITYLGDGEWDVRCSAILGWGFVGIADGGRAQALRDAGAERVYPDFTALVVQ